MLEIYAVGGYDEIGKNMDTGEILIKIDPRYFRPTEVDFLLGDPSKARQKMNWEPTISFQELVRLLVLEDLKLAQKDSYFRKKGFKTYNHFE